MGFEQVSEDQSRKLDTMIKAMMARNPRLVIALAKEQGCDINGGDFWATVHIGVVLGLFAINADDIDMDEVRTILKG